MTNVTLATMVAVAFLAASCTQSPEARKQHAVERGKKRLAAKDYARAILEFRNATQADPRDAESYYQLALAYIAALDVPSAARSLRQATELNPAHANAQIKLAEILSTVRNPDLLKDAAERMETLLASSPNNPDALRTLAYIELGLGEKDDAEQHLAEAVENGPGNLKSAVSLAQLKISQKKLGEAEQILRRAAEEKQPTATAFTVLGAFYVDTARFVEAKRELLKALDVEKDNVIASLLIGKLQLKAGETAEAEKTFRRVSDLPDKRYKTLYAMYLFQTGKHDQAVQEFERMVAANPQDRTLRRQLLSAYMFVGKTAEAERTLNAALKTNAKDTDALLARSKLSFANGKYTEAHNDINQVIRFEPNSAEAHYLLARLYEIRGNEQSQRQELSEAIRLNPRMLPARIELSRLLTPTNPKAAIQLINEAPESQRRTPAAIAQKNWALLASRDKAAAATGVAQAITIARTSDILLQDAVVKLQRNDITGARTSLDESLKKFPQEIRALELLAQTYVMQKQPAIATRRILDHAEAYPKSASVQHFLGSWLERSSVSRTEAKTAFLSAKAADPSFWQADLSLAALDITDNKLESARKSLTPLLSHPKAGLRARLLLASAEDKGGDRVAALGHYRKVLEDQPDNLFALNNLAYALAEYANSPDEALQIATRAKELAPDNATIDDTLGWIYYKKGLYSNAIQYLETSVKRDANASRRVHLASAYAKRGDTQRAIEQLAEAMKLDPALPELVTAQKLIAGR